MLIRPCMWSTMDHMIKLTRVQVHDERISVIGSNPNLGLSSALNRGLDEVQERFVIRMDADDEMDPRE